MADVYVVMSNDFPHAVYKHEAAADAFVKEKNADEAEQVRTKRVHTRIYWVVYKFTLMETAGA